VPSPVVFSLTVHDARLLTYLSAADIYSSTRPSCYNKQCSLDSCHARLVKSLTIVPYILAKLVNTSLSQAHFRRHSDMRFTLVWAICGRSQPKHAIAVILLNKCFNPPKLYPLSGNNTGKQSVSYFILNDEH